MMKRLALSMLSVAAIAALVAGATFALFTDNKSANETFSAGSVTLTDNAAADCPVDTQGMAPGDNGTCTFTVTYEGSLDAWIGMDVSGSGALFGGATPITLSDSYTTVAGHKVIGEFAKDDEITASVNWSFPSTATDSYENASGQVNVTFYAVQSRNNTNAGNNGPVAWDNN